MKKLKNILFSMELTGLLLLLFAIAIGYATFVENDFGTVASKSTVYNAKWFEFMLLLLAVNMNFVAFSRFLGNMDGQVFVFFILTVAAAEAAIGLAILVVLFRNRGTINVAELDELKG